VAKDHSAVNKRLWYKEAIIYELHVKAFFDSNDDGIGDFAGLTRKLDYLQDLGINTIWVLPFYPSPQKDDGYDISDFKGVHPAYGNLSDFRMFLRQATKRDMKVITELVLNHTSDQHRWFKKSRNADAGNRWKDYYVWEDSPEKYGDTRIIFEDFESSNWSWDPERKQYFWHRFYSHQPDLNYDNPAVEKDMTDIVDFWLQKGINGLRLDAVPYLYEREGTECENLPPTHDFIKRLRRHIDDRFKDRMLLGEANQWPENASQYFGDEDECHMLFHFPLMPRIFMSLHMEDRFPIIDILNQTPDIPHSCQWTLFLRNHDELTLEMVSDQERDYMYRAYATDPNARINLGIRRRLAPLLNNDRNRIRLMNGLLFTLPGTPVIYYGDEIGMGDNFYLGDRDGVRTPMQWNGDKNAGFSKCNPQKLYLPVIIDPEYHFQSVNVETMLGNPSSLLWWMKKLINLRKSHMALSYGDLVFLYPDNNRILAFTRTRGKNSILAVFNLSRFSQPFYLDLSEYRGCRPVELFGHTGFPPVDENPYFLSLGPHSFYLFSLEGIDETERVPESGQAKLPELAAYGKWEKIMDQKIQTRKLERSIMKKLPGFRWFGNKADTITSVKILDVLPVRGRDETHFIIPLLVRLSGRQDQVYCMILGYMPAEDQRLQAIDKNRMISRISVNKDDTEQSGFIYEASGSEGFWHDFLARSGRKGRRIRGKVSGLVTDAGFRRSVSGISDDSRLEVLGTEQSNTSVAIDKSYVFKLYRKLVSGHHPDVEMMEYLTRKGFRNTPSLRGRLLLHGKDINASIGLVQEYISNQGDVWSYTIELLGRYFEQALINRDEIEKTEPPEREIFQALEKDTPEMLENMAQPYLDQVRLLGQRTAGLHLILAGETSDRDFRPEAFTMLYQKALYQSLRNLLMRTFDSLKAVKSSMPEDEMKLLEDVEGSKDRILDIFSRLRKSRIEGIRIRCHNDYHLGQVLFTGNDFMIIDFEGEPARTASERMTKRSPFYDAASMLRSFHYAAETALKNERHKNVHSAEDIGLLEHAAGLWYHLIGNNFLDSYMETARGSRLSPSSMEDMFFLIKIFMLEKAVYELNYEANNRPEWVGIPLKGIKNMMTGK
jgi:maltose alpha-D-glucosyltransferase / alpha-amylase